MIPDTFLELTIHNAMKKNHYQALFSITLGLYNKILVFQESYSTSSIGNTNIISKTPGYKSVELGDQITINSVLLCMPDVTGRIIVTG